jgi:hypothetical protein
VSDVLSPSNFSLPPVNEDPSNSTSQPAVSSSAAQDWSSTVQLKLKLFESQTAKVSQAGHVTHFASKNMSMSELNVGSYMPNFERMSPPLLSLSARCKSCSLVSKRFICQGAMFRPLQ